MEIFENPVVIDESHLLEMHKRIDDLFEANENLRLKNRAVTSELMKENEYHAKLVNNIVRYLAISDFMNKRETISNDSLELITKVSGGMISETDAKDIYLYLLEEE